MKKKKPVVLPAPRDTGGPAYARPYSIAKGQYASDDTSYSAQQGMTLRDAFAKAALPSALTQFYATGGAGEAWTDHDDLAEHVYHVADAMIAARKKTQP